MKFYRRRSKLIPEDWTEEIKKWEKYYMNDKYYTQTIRNDLLYEQRQKEFEERIAPLKMIRKMKKKEEEELLLLDCDGEYCGHPRKIEMDGMIICYHCGKELGRCYGKNVGYNHKNHVMRGAKK